MPFRALVLAVMLIYVLTESLAVKDGYSEYDLPNPLKNYSACGQSQRGYICDPGNYLTPSQVDQLNAVVDAMKTVTRCLCDRMSCRVTPRHEVMVAVVPKIKYTTGSFPGTYELQLKAAKAFAEYLRDTLWYTSDTNCKMRAIIVYDVTTTAIWTSTNKFARKVITDDRAKETGRNAKIDWLKQGSYYLGIRDMLEKYQKFLVDGPPGMAWWKILLIVSGSLPVFGLGTCISRRNGGGGSSRSGGTVWSHSSSFGTTGGSTCGSSCGGGGGGCGGGGGD